MLRDREIVLPGIARAAGGVILLAPYPVWVNRVTLTARRSLPAYTQSRAAINDAMRHQMEPLSWKAYQSWRSRGTGSNLPRA
jgi:hypothetical protein